MSANLTVAPQYLAQFALARKVIGLVITSSPSFMPSANIAMCKPDVALLTATQYFAPV